MSHSPVRLLSSLLSINLAFFWDRSASHFARSVRLFAIVDVVRSLYMYAEESYLLADCAEQPGREKAESAVRGRKQHDEYWQDACSSRTARTIQFPTRDDTRYYVRKYRRTHDNTINSRRSN